MNNSPGMIHILIPKALLILTRDEYIRAIKRGKAYKRREALEQRIANNGTGK